MEDDVYQKVFEDSRAKIKAAIIRDMDDDDFLWERYLTAMVEDESPLEEVFSQRTLQLAQLHLLAINIQSASSNVEEVSIIKEDDQN